MKIHKKYFDEKKLEGSIELMPEYPDDIYSLYNLIDKGDIIKSRTQRKIVVSNKNTERIYIKLEIVIESITVDLEANVIFFKGKTLTEHEHIKMGSFHTIEITLNDKLWLTKKEWNLLSLKILRDAETEYTEIFVVLLFDKECFVYSITQNYVKNILKQEIKNKNYKNIITFLEKANLKIIKSIIIASTSEERNIFLKNISSNKNIKENLEKFCSVKLDSDYSKMSGNKIIEKMMGDAVVLKKLHNVQFLKDLKEMEVFLTLFNTSSEYIAVGISDVQEGIEYGAVKSLLLTSEVFKSFDIEERKKIEKLILDVKAQNANLFVIPIRHFYGEKLAEMGGVAAILKFPYRET
ncbi:PelA-like RNA-binding protein [Hamiltosporidium tvaerminnensis]|uniref:PelA-like RNA-binding protein n=2 Tax=Hamiltosporidium TaxID=1176354 RepID=A0A4Q9LN57_9MICR|nr:PelA-like RNA-binding protein [Hamiltosporidium magnivora]TBU11851.1 PelA-like RNA-binding protein [Hamiltosporidium tvaerminnensis]